MIYTINRDTEGLYQIEVDGKNFTFHVINNSTEPCNVCGVPACGKEDILWYTNHEGNNIALIFDGAYLEFTLYDCIGENLHLLKKNALPIFLKDFNEAKGWENSWDYNGYELDIDDFLKSIELVKNANIENGLPNEVIADIEKLALEAQQNGKALKIVRG